MNNLPAIKNTASEETTTTNDPPKEKGANAPKGDGPEYPDRNTGRPVKTTGRVYFEGGELVGVVDGIRATEFDAEPDDIIAHLTPRERRTFELRAAAVRYIAGIEPRSFSEVADDLGVTTAAVSSIYRDTLARIGCSRIFDNGVKRWKLREATARYHQKRRAAA